MAKESNKPKANPQKATPQKETPSKATSSKAAQTKTPARTGSRSAERERTGGRTVERRRERERERQRQRLVTGGVIAFALVAVVVIIVLIVNAPAGAPIPAGALTRYEGIQQSHTIEGYPRLGDPNASVQVAEYSSFGCPHCRDFNTQWGDQVISRVKTGKMAFTYVPLYGYGNVANDQGAAAAALCADEQDKFWPFHDALFDWQGEFGNQAFTNNRISTGVTAFALDQGKYSACIASSRPGTILDAARRQAAALLNFPNSTPTFTINGVIPLDDNQQPLDDINTIFARIDAEIARIAGQATPESTAPAAATSEATQTVTSEPTQEATAAATAEATAESTPAS